MPLQDFFVIIPAYEPDEKMLMVIDDIKRRTDFKIIAVNDGSCSEKDEIFNKAAENAVVLKHSQNRGKGAAIKTALGYILDTVNKSGEKCGVIIVDADGQHKVKDIVRVAQGLEENENMLVMGCRKFSGNIPFRSKFGNSVTKFVFSFAAGVKVSDTQTGLRGFTTDKIPFMLNIEGERYEYEMNMLLECANENIKFYEIEIETVYIEGNKSSHFHPIKDSYRIYKDILKFSCSSFLSFLLDYLFFSMFVLLTKRLTLSNICARIISSSFNFAMNKKYVFKNKESLLKTAVKYFTLAAFILAANTCLLNLCTAYLIKNRYIAKIIIEIIMFLFNWIMQKRFVFKRKERVEDKK